MTRWYFPVSRIINLVCLVLFVSQVTYWAVAIGPVVPLVGGEVVFNQVPEGSV